MNNNISHQTDKHSTETQQSYHHQFEKENSILDFECSSEINWDSPAKPEWTPQSLHFAFLSYKSLSYTSSHSSQLQAQLHGKKNSHFSNTPMIFCHYYWIPQISTASLIVILKHISAIPL